MPILAAVPSVADIAYAAAAAVVGPAMLVRGRRAKLAAAWRERDGDVLRRAGGGPGVLVHAVSVGEVNATRELVRQLREVRPDVGVVVSVTTDTGHARAAEVFAGTAGVAVVRFPLDFSGRVRRFLDAVRPDVVVLMELEVWPNFVAECRRRGVAVILGNGRITGRSFAGYRRLGPLVRPTFRRLDRVLAQDEAYADRFRQLGCGAVEVAGSMKFDTAAAAPPPGTDALAAEVGVAGERLWVCGSTGPGEEALILDALDLLRARGRGEAAGVNPRPASVTPRLAIVPRHPERFDEVAELIVRRTGGVTRLSDGRAGAPPVGGAVILGDSMGELRKWWALAGVAFVGRSLVDLGPSQHGSDMIEPAALGVPVVVGPFTGNFAAAMAALRSAGAVAEVRDAAELAAAVAGADSERGRRAAAAVDALRGATARHVAAVLEHLPAA